jgi:monovalent cation:H+ antiporter-2, CPA2 family
MHDVVQLLLELGLLVGGLGILGAVAGRFGISAIPLYLLAGLAFGTGGLYEFHAIDGFLEVGAEIGVVMLLFALGLEYSPRELIGTMRTSWRAALVDLALNATPGVVCAFILGWGPVAAIVLGGVTYVSSSGIVAKVLTDLGWLGNRETPTVLAILVAEDLIMAVYLPILTTVLAGVAIAQGAWGLALALVAVAGALFVASRYGGLLGRLLESPSDEILLLKVLGIVLVIAGLAEQVHVSAAVGAFFVGIALSGDVSHQSEKVLEPLKHLFSAIFFVNFGLQTDPSQLPPVLPIALALAVVCVGTKFTTGWWAAGQNGSAFSGRLRAGLVLIPRGEFSIVIAGLGVAAGVEPQLGSLAAAYVLILAATGPLATRLADPISRKRRDRMRARRLAAATAGSESRTADDSALDRS